MQSPTSVPSQRPANDHRPPVSVLQCESIRHYNRQTSASAKQLLYQTHSTLRFRGTDEANQQQRAMGPSTMARALAAAAAVLAAVVCAGATPETTCRAAAGADRRVDYRFCVSRLSQHHDSPDADTWGLAKVAADVGVLMASNGVYDIKAMLAGKEERPAGARARGPLEQCEALYDRMGAAFAEAYDGIDRRDYAAGKEKAGEAASLARRCAHAFARAGVAVPPRLAKQGADSVQMAIVCTAITNLVK
ncbi:hypothetical protein CFC21_019039 [Triticum aestivum]|uniref:Pectinesterase inhibitor domain-containing protein n=4 Tax=Triticum TaxID=4564 RepID=A0A9R1P4J6_TRITD|nr:pectinesterase inhibitor 8-like [Triticum aestivum]KAF7003751.1 hypothetical protein CFC21_019039 [Triticum aestivum]VAH36755.1 unnamed protein product [Triticum turgidum subsp. durum]